MPNMLIYVNSINALHQFTGIGKTLSMLTVVARPYIVYEILHETSQGIQFNRKTVNHLLVTGVIHAGFYSAHEDVRLNIFRIHFPVKHIYKHFNTN